MTTTRHTGSPALAATAGTLHVARRPTSAPATDLSTTDHGWTAVSDMPGVVTG